MDSFHITMRVTVLQQQTEGLQEEHPQFGGKVSKQLEDLQEPIWHGNVEEALERLREPHPGLRPAFGPTPLQRQSSTMGITEFDTYIGIIRGSSPLGERRRQGETIATAFVSRLSTVVSRRFVKKQQMLWTLRSCWLAAADPDESPRQ